MSLFDVLKYPVSDPPTKEEIEVLPHSIISRLYDKLFNNGVDLDLQYKITIIYAHVLIWGDSGIITSKYIRNTLKEYNEHI